MQKQFTILKVGYTAGIYGCSGEYFTCIYTGNAGMGSFSFSGMYGADERVSGEMKARGYKNIYCQSDYGKMKSRDIPRNRFMGEGEAVEFAKTI